MTTEDIKNMENGDLLDKLLTVCTEGDLSKGDLSDDTVLMQMLRLEVVCRMEERKGSNEKV